MPVGAREDEVHRVRRDITVERSVLTSDRSELGMMNLPGAEPGRAEHGGDGNRDDYEDEGVAGGD